nr:MAG TPA: hypothetical protein [Caudoviricetes sp.]
MFIRFGLKLYGYRLGLILYPRFTFQRPEFYLMADLSK